MPRIYKCSEWESPTGKWYVADVSDLANYSAAWWLPARFLNISPAEYINLLVTKYNAVINLFDADAANGKSMLVFYWNEYKDAHKYLLDMNRLARNNKWTI